MKPIIFSWDYMLWPTFRGLGDSEPYPEIRSRVSPKLASDLAQWAEDMYAAYSDETGVIRPTPSAADELDERFDDLTLRLLAEGVDVEQGDRWWRT